MQRGMKKSGLARKYQWYTYHDIFKRKYDIFDIFKILTFIIITRHSLVRAKGEVFLLLYVFLFGQRFLDNPRADSSQVLHAGAFWFRICLLPFWGLAAPGGRKKGKMKFSLLWESMGIFLHFGGFWAISQQRVDASTFHTKFYLCRDNVCRRVPSHSGVHRPLRGRGRRS